MAAFVLTQRLTGEQSQKKGREGGVVSVFTTFVQGFQGYELVEEVKNAPFLYIWSFSGIVFHLDQSIYSHYRSQEKRVRVLTSPKESCWVKDIINTIPSCLFFWMQELCGKIRNAKVN